MERNVKVLLDLPPYIVEKIDAVMLERVHARVVGRYSRTATVMLILEKALGIDPMSHQQTSPAVDIVPVKQKRMAKY